jgi:hypothetical protein
MVHIVYIVMSFSSDNTIFLAVNKRMLRSIKAVEQIKRLSQHMLIPDVFKQPSSAEHGLQTLKRNGDKVCYCEMLLN